MNSPTWMGPAYPTEGWVPAPRYLMRRARILRMARDMPRGRLLEVGPGAATLLTEFQALGFRCEGLELSDEAREMATRLIALSGAAIPVHDRPADDWNGAFDALFAFDVLEHIEDDRAALLQWRGWMRPGATLLLSVPARMRLWTAGDEWAGHYRRYERDALKQLLDECGFAIDRFECYGFPLTNLSERASARAYRRTLREAADDQATTRRINNDRSGVDRRPVMRLYPFLRSPVGAAVMHGAFALQTLFLEQDWGSGYLLRATVRGQ